MTTIIQVRGTSGSGKTTVMREVMDGITNKWKPNFIEGRKRPLYYSYMGLYAVLGHYEIDCGGCDTIGSVPQVFRVIESLQSNFKFILGEGLLLSEDVIWVEKYDANILFLTTSVDRCLKRVEKRQQAKGRKPKDPERVVRKLTTRIGTIERARLRLLEKPNILCRRASSKQASKIILKWLE